MIEKYGDGVLPWIIVLLFCTFMAKIKCVKVRALFAKNKVRFARAEQLCLGLAKSDMI